MFCSCLFCVAACLRVCTSAVGTLAWGSVWLLDCVAVSRRCVAKAARRRFTCRLRRATVLLFGRVIDTS